MLTMISKMIESNIRSLCLSVCLSLSLSMSLSVSLYISASVCLCLSLCSHSLSVSFYYASLRLPVSLCSNTTRLNKSALRFDVLRIRWKSSEQQKNVSIVMKLIAVETSTASSTCFEKNEWRRRRMRRGNDVQLDRMVNGHHLQLTDGTCRP